jgi:osmotically-inducible protein OsmY
MGEMDNLEGLGLQVQVEIRAEKGVIFLRGTVTSPVLKEECERRVAALEGVERVENQLSVTEDYRYA